jgi:CheY-specific phosphatase CheX
MEITLNEKLYRASARTFEDLAFLLTAEKADEAQAALPLERTVSVRFHGSFSGSLVLKVSRGLAPALAANMLGIDGEAPEGAQLDALKETANVLCGNVLPEIAGHKEVFRLDAPELGQAGSNTQPAAKVELMVEAGRCEVEFYSERALS